MGEIFEKTEPRAQLSWTGERLTAGAGPQVEIEHIHRYFVARDLCRGRDVLDIASGEGYGSMLIAQTARSVVGVEIDPDSVSHAQAAYRQKNLSFLLGDALKIPLQDASVDVVVSFETIEHFYDHDTFLSEVKRVLRPGGQFIVSSPDRDVYSPPGSKPNPYHVRELSRGEFLALLELHFKNVVLHGQRNIVGSALVAERRQANAAAPHFLTFERRGASRFQASQELQRPLYLIAIASDQPIETRADSLYIETDEVEKALIAERELAGTRRVLHDAEQYVQHLLFDLTKRENSQFHLVGERSILAERLADAAADALAVQLDIHELHNRIARLQAELQDASRAAAQSGAAEVAAPSLQPAATEKARFAEKMKAELRDFLASGDRLTFAETPAPDISVVVVLWNQAHFTLGCLRALLAQSGPGMEVVLVDNRSTDETSELLGRIDGIQVVRNERNVGFLEGCNIGAAAARGRSLLLLNSDAFVRPGALAAAFETLGSADDIGAVGGRLILPSGRLQEAGSIVWRDGSCLGYARDLRADAGEAMFRRDVDFCSGAFLLTPSKLWRELGGFDEAFKPAYYEEVDYCMRLREAGYRVVYEPLAVVDHFEFGSEVASGEAIASQLRGRAVFVKKHAAALARHHLAPKPENIVFARTDARRKPPRLLVIDNEVPLGALGSGYPRAREMLVGARNFGWSVTMYPLHQPPFTWEAVRREIPSEVEFIDQGGPARLPAFLQERRGCFDVVLVSRPDNMTFVRGVLRRHPDALGGAKLIYDAEAVAAGRLIARAEVEGRPLNLAEAGALVSAELAIAAGADGVVCVSPRESLFFKDHNKQLFTLGHSLACTDDAAPFADRSGFLFVGRLLETHAPNWQGLLWFVRSCWPLIKRGMPQATLTVVGHVHDEHDELLAPGVHLAGPVDDLRPLYARARVFIAPTLFAAGIPLKIVEAAAYGLPVAGTSLMAEQLGWRDGIEMAAANDPADFAAAAVDLYRNQALWESIRAAAQLRVEQEYNARSFFAELERMLASAIGQPRGPGADAGGDADEDHRISRVQAVWGKRGPQELADQWAMYPMSHPAVNAAMNRRMSGDVAIGPYERLRAQLIEWGFLLPITKAVSLCCGAGALERGLVQERVIAACTGYDLAEAALEAAREAAAAEGMEGLVYEARDLERFGIDKSGLDIVFAHQGVHHITQLEAVFDSVFRALKPGGIFHLHEFVGPDRFQWTDRQLEEMNRWLKTLPGRYRRTRDGTIKDVVGRATVEDMINHDPSEAVRSSAIERLVAERFEIVERRALGGTLAMSALADIGHNFDPASAADMVYLEALLEREDELMGTGELGSDFVVITARRPVQENS